MKSVLAAILFLPITTAGAVAAQGVGAGIEVATQNLYVGADLLRVASGPAEEVPFRVAETLQVIVRNDFPTRVRGVARELALRRPDLIGLQEVSLLRTQSPGDFLIGNPVPAQAVLYDYLQILLDELDRLGVHYYVAAEVQGADVELPSFAGMGPLGPLFDDVRLTDRDVILARVDVATGFEASGQYSEYLALSLGGATVGFQRCFTSVEALVRGQRFRFVDTHLEIDTEDAVDYYQSAQAEELVALLATETLPLIVVGDFNSDPRHLADPFVPPYTRMVDAGYVDSWTLRPGPLDDGYTCCQSEVLDDPTSTLNERFDLVWLRNATLGPVQIARMGATTRERVDGLWPSDHAGVFARIHLRLTP